MDAVNGWEPRRSAAASFTLAAAVAGVAITGVVLVGHAVSQDTGGCMLEVPPEPPPLQAPVVPRVCRVDVSIQDQLRQVIIDERRDARAAVSRAWHNGRRTGIRVGRRSVIVRSDVRHLIGVIATAVGVDPAAARRVAWCESRYTPGAANGRYLGVYQFGAPLWSTTPFRGYPRTDAAANTAAAMWVVRRTGWGPWECRP
jgi:hypothetical protein